MLAVDAGQALLLLEPCADGVADAGAVGSRVRADLLDDRDGVVADHDWEVGFGESAETVERSEWQRVAALTRTRTWRLVDRGMGRSWIWKGVLGCVRRV